MKIRAFIAFPVPAETRAAFASIQSELKASGADVKWDAPEKFHVTMKFLGDVEEPELNLLRRDLIESLGKLSGFELLYSGVGGFPDTDHPRVVWIGAEKNETILQVHREIERAAEVHGFPREDRSFHVHITLGRVKGSRNLDRLTARLKSVTFKPLLVHCAEVHIIRSELKPSGSVYTLLNSIPLAL